MLVPFTEPVGPLDFRDASVWLGQYGWAAVIGVVAGWAVAWLLMTAAQHFLDIEVAGFFAVAVYGGCAFLAIGLVLDAAAPKGCYYDYVGDRYVQTCPGKPLVPPGTLQPGLAQP